MTTVTLAARPTETVPGCGEEDARVSAERDREDACEDAYGHEPSRVITATDMSHDTSEPDQTCRTSEPETDRDIPDTELEDDVPDIGIAADAGRPHTPAMFPEGEDVEYPEEDDVRCGSWDPCGPDDAQAGGDEVTDASGRQDEVVPGSLGERGEAAAAAYLERQGLEILERNWRCRFGEADIIARDDDEIVFVEVKTRQGIEQGMPEDAVTRQKRDRYEKIAASYLSEHAFVDCFIRFDVIAILVTNGKQGLLRHHRSAFSHGE